MKGSYNAVIEAGDYNPFSHGPLFDADCRSGLRCPFILMDFVDGIPLPRIWFNHSISLDVLDKRRLQVL